MATLPIQQVTSNGITIAKSAAAVGGDQFANTGNETFHIENGHSGAQSAQFTAQTPCDMGTLHNKLVAVAAGAEGAIKGLRIDRFNDGNRMCQVTYPAGVTLLTVYVVN